MSDDVPSSVWSGLFTLMGVEMRCHVLSDGRRVIEEQSVLDFLKALEAGEVRPDPDEAADFAKWMQG